MTAYTLNFRNTVTVQLAAKDTFAETPFGLLFIVGDVDTAAIIGAGNNTVTLAGGVVDTNATRDGLSFSGGANTITLAAGAYVTAARNAIYMTGGLGVGGGNVINNAGTITAQGGAAIYSSIANNQFNLSATSAVQGLSGISFNGGSGAVISNAGTVVGTMGDAIGMNGGSNTSTLAFFSGSYVQGQRAVFIDGGGNTLNNVGALYGIATDAVEFNGGGNTINNVGRVVGQRYGIQIGSGGTNAIVNSGLIQSKSLWAIRSTSAINLVNTGTIDGAESGVIISGAATGSQIVNSGVIYGHEYSALETGGGADIVVNNGVIQSAGFSYVDLGAGNDFFDGRNGIQNQIDGADGDDVLFGGAANDQLEGGADNDQLSGGGGADQLIGDAGFDYARYDLGGAVTASLATPAANTGDAAGDTYFSIEGLIGSSAGDLLVGDAGANTIMGMAGMDGIAGGDGNDTLYGGDSMDSIAGQAGNDIIVGGGGGDVLSGGAGADLFTYTSTGDGGDLIQDFNAGGVRDGFDLRALFDATGYAGNDPRGAGLMSVVQNGADTDVYVYGAFLFRIPNLYAPALNDTYFLFQ